MFFKNRRLTYLPTFQEKIFKVDSSCGILKPGEKKVIKLFLMSSDDWPLAYGEYTQKRLKLAVECLRVPDEIQPTSEKVRFCGVAEAEEKISPKNF